MPAAPMASQIAREVDRLSTGWPTLKEAWRWQGPYAGGIFGMGARCWVLMVGIVNVFMIPVWAWGFSGHPVSDFWSQRASDGVLLGVSAAFCLFMLWHAHVGRRDPHKAWLVTGVVLAYCAWRESERRERRDRETRS